VKNTDDGGTGRGFLEVDVETLTKDMYPLVAIPDLALG
jgi:hypothetical protein